jgi:hypothetical protein
MNKGIVWVVLENMLPLKVVIVLTNLMILANRRGRDGEMPLVFFSILMYF